MRAPSRHLRRSIYPALGPPGRITPRSRSTRAPSRHPRRSICPALGPPGRLTLSHALDLSSTRTSWSTRTHKSQHLLTPLPPHALPPIYQPRRILTRTHKSQHLLTPLPPRATASSLSIHLSNLSLCASPLSLRASSLKALDLSSNRTSWSTHPLSLPSTPNHSAPQPN